jgi:hypothetical protein
VFRSLSDNYGTAGPIFIQHVVANRDTIATELLETQQRIDATLQLERSDRFISSVFACAVVAGRIMERLGLHNIDLRRVYAAAAKAVSKERERKEDLLGDVQTMAFETLSSFITQNVGNTLVINSDAAMAMPTEIPHGPLRIRYEPDTQEMIIVASELRNFFVARRVDFKSSLEVFVKAEALKSTPKGLTVTRRPAAGANGSLRGAPTRCYVFDAEKLGMTDLPGDGRH